MQCRNLSSGNQYDLILLRLVGIYELPLCAAYTGLKSSALFQLSDLGSKLVSIESIVACLYLIVGLVFIKSTQFYRELCLGQGAFVSMNGSIMFQPGVKCISE